MCEKQIVIECTECISHQKQFILQHDLSSQEAKLLLLKHNLDELFSRLPSLSIQVGAVLVQPHLHRK